MMKSVKKNSNQKGLWIPIAILEDEKLDSSNKLLLTMIYSYLDNGKKCYASNNYFGKTLGINGSAVSKRVSKLKKLGYINLQMIYQKGANTVRLIHRNNSKSTTPHDSDLLGGISSTTTTLVPDELGGISPTDIRVVPKELGGISQRKHINIDTNTDIEINKEKRIPVEVTNIDLLVNRIDDVISNEGYEYYQQQYDDAVLKLGECSELGKEIYEYIKADKLEEIKKVLGKIKYEQLKPTISMYKYTAKLFNII